MGNQPAKVEVITYEEPAPPPPDPEIEVDITVNEFGDVTETETIVVPEPQPYIEPVVIETFPEPEMPPYVEPVPQPYFEPGVIYNPYMPPNEPVLVEEYYSGEPEVEVTTYPYGNPSGFVEYDDESYPDDDPFISDDVVPYP